MTASKTISPSGRQKTSPRGAAVDYGGLLAGRAREFLRWVELILTKSAPSPDDVHDARVAGRRLIAALRFFEPLLRRRRSRRLRHAVRSAIGALGDFRDADILVGLLERAATSQPAGQTDQQDPTQAQSASDPLTAAKVALQAGRDAAAARSREAFEAALPHAVLRGLQRLADRGVPRRYSRPPWPDLLPCFAALQMRRVADEFAALAVTVNRTSPPETLHRLRIVGKRLRYSVEITLPAPAARPLLETLRGLQDMLGTLHDLDVAIEYVAKLARDTGGAVSVFDPPRPAGATPANPRLATAADRLRADRAALHRRFLRNWPRRRFESLARRITKAAASSGAVLQTPDD